MNHLYKYGRYFYAIGFIAFGIMHFVYGDFITGRAPSWPEQFQGQYFWAGISGLIMIVTGLSIFSTKWVRFAALFSAAIIFAWALLRHIPIVVADQLLGGAWTQLGKAIVFLSGILAIAGSYPKENYRGFLASVVNTREKFIQFGKISLGLYLILCGIQHFLFTEFVASLIPPLIPWAEFWTYFAGICLIAGGIGILIPATSKLAALFSGLMIFSWVFIVHIPLAVTGFAGNNREWISVFEAFAISGLAFYLSAILSKK